MWAPVHSEGQRMMCWLCRRINKGERKSEPLPKSHRVCVIISIYPVAYRPHWIMVLQDIKKGKGKGPNPVLDRAAPCRHSETPLSPPLISQSLSNMRCSTLYGEQEGLFYWVSCTARVLKTEICRWKRVSDSGPCTITEICIL